MGATSVRSRDRIRAVTIAVLIASATMSCGAADERSGEINDTPSGSKLTVPQVVQIAYDAGFTSERQLVAVTAIAVAESSLVVQQRNWHPEYGFRPAGTVLGVT